MKANPGAQPGVPLQKLLHQVGVARKNHNHLLAVVFHLLHNGVEGLIAIAAAAVVHQRIRLVDEQHTPLCLRKDVLGGSGRPADKPVNQIAPPDLNQLPGGKNSVFLQNPGIQPRNRGLCRAGIAGKHHMQSGSPGIHPLFAVALPQPIIGKDDVHLPLDVRKPDHLLQLLIRRPSGPRLLPGNLPVLRVDNGLQLPGIPVPGHPPQRRGRIGLIALQPLKQALVPVKAAGVGLALQKPLRIGPGPHVLLQLHHRNLPKAAKEIVPELSGVLRQANHREHLVAMGGGQPAQQLRQAPGGTASSQPRGDQPDRQSAAPAQPVIALKGGVRIPAVHIQIQDRQAPAGQPAVGGQHLQQKPHGPDFQLAVKRADHIMDRVPRQARLLLPPAAYAGKFRKQALAQAAFFGCGGQLFPAAGRYQLLQAILGQPAAGAQSKLPQNRILIGNIVPPASRAQRLCHLPEGHLGHRNRIRQKPHAAQEGRCSALLFPGGFCQISQRYNHRIRRTVGRAQRHTPLLGVRPDKIHSEAKRIAEPGIEFRAGSGRVRGAAFAAGFGDGLSVRGGIDAAPDFIKQHLISSPFFLFNSILAEATHQKGDNRGKKLPEGSGPAGEACPLGHPLPVLPAFPCRNAKKDSICPKTAANVP